MRTLSLSLTCIGALTFGACVSVDIDDNETENPGNNGPTVEFDPASSIVPFPNNLLLDPSNGIVNLPEGCNEGPASAATRTGVLNTLNGFGTFKSAISATFTEAVDPDSLTGNVKIYKRASAGMPIDPGAATEVPILIIPGETARDSADCMSTSAVANATFVPLVPLDGDSTYTVVITGNVTTMDGASFVPSFTWELTRLAENPITVDEAGNIVADKTPLDPFDPEDRARLEGINLLWNAHAGALAFLTGTGLARDDIHLAWDFNTQTTTRPLDATVTGSLADNIDPLPLGGVISLIGIDPLDVDVPTFIERRLGVGTCSVLPCVAVSDIVGGGLSSKSYQSLTPNPIGGDMVPGPFADPVAPAEVGANTIGVLSFIPQGTPPENGWPTIIFGHGITRSQGDLLAIGSQLAGAGFLTISIDWVAHGSRAIQIDNTGLCADVSGGPSALPQCFAPILSTNLETTRDNIRQSVLDGLGLIEALKACGTDACGAIQVDATRLGYIGQSLGAIIGTVLTSMSTDIRASVLNVGGVGLVDVVENTDSIGIRCSIVNGLIAAGIIAGEENVTCLTDEWKADPGYRRFAVIGRWILDPSDGANFLAGLGTKSVLLQEVIDDETVPNFATDQQAALMGLTALAADPGVGQTASVAITGGDPTATKWVTYDDVPAAGPFPGNEFSHGSLLAPDPTGGGQPGGAGTAQMQLDAITFLGINTAPLP